MGMIQDIDCSILNVIQDSLRCEFLDSFAVILSYLTNWGIIWCIIGVMMLLFRKTRVTGIILITALITVFLIGDVLLKHLIFRPRPFITDPNIKLLIKTPLSSSFPSTHSCFAATATTILLVKKRSFGLIALALALCITFSRLYLYVHYPTDVFCGCLLGVSCALATLRGVKRKGLKEEVSPKRIKP